MNSIRGEVNYRLEDMNATMSIRNVNANKRKSE